MRHSIECFFCCCRLNPLGRFIEYQARYMLLGYAGYWLWKYLPVGKKQRILCTGWYLSKGIYFSARLGTRMMLLFNTWISSSCHLLIKHIQFRPYLSWQAPLAATNQNSTELLLTRSRSRSFSSNPVQTAKRLWLMIASADFLCRIGSANLTSYFAWLKGVSHGYSFFSVSLL